MNELTICEKISVINVIHLCEVELLHTIASFGITQTIRLADEVPDDRIRRNELHPEAENVDQMARDSEEK